MSLNYNDLLVAGIVGVGLAVYLLFMIGWCVYQHLSHQQIPHQRLNSSLGEKSFAFRRINRYLVSSFKYRKGGIDIPEEDEASDADCVICLLGFEDGEDLQKLPRCNHSFHAPCIDMWLYSHSDCPLCREQMLRSSSFSTLE